MSAPFAARLMTMTAVFVTLLASMYAASTAVAAETTSGSSITWTIAPSTPDGADGRISIRAELDPGETVSDYVTVTNFSEVAATFRVYASDGLINDAGDFDLLGPDTAPRDGGEWITPQATTDAIAAEGGSLTTTLDPQSSVTIPITISVPASATPGDHPAGVVAELVPQSDSEVEMATRVGVRVHLRVNGDIVAALSPGDVRAEWSPSWNPFAPGTVRVRYATENTGNVRLGSESTVTVSGPFGWFPSSSSATEREILAGDVAVESAEVTAWPLIYGMGVIEITPNAVGTDSIESALTTVTSDVTVWTVPWSQLVLLILITAIVLGVITARRRSKVRLQAAIDAAVAAAKAPQTTDA